MLKKLLLILSFLLNSCNDNDFQQFDAAALDDAFFTDFPEINDQQFLDFKEVEEEKYTEPLDEKKDISDLLSSYSQSKWYETLIALLDARYKTGHYIVSNVSDSKNQAEIFAKTASVQELIYSASTVVHELNHAYNFENSSYYNYTCRVRHDLEFTVPYFYTFPRSEILEYITWDDFYAEVYLTGTMGKQGFDSVIEELNAYIQSLFTDFAFVDQLPKNIYISSRDGVITFMIYTALYLMHARTKVPDTFKKITENSEWRELILTLFGRAEFILEITEKYKNLGIEDDMLLDKFDEMNLYDEIVKIKEM